MRESVVVEPKPPSVLANGLWFWRSLRWGGRRERMLAGIAAILLIAMLVVGRGGCSVNQSSMIATLSSADPVIQTKSVLERIKSAQKAIHVAHESITRDQAGTDAFKELLREVAELEEFVKPGEIRDGKYVSFTDAELQERRRRANLHLYSLRPAYTSVRPILESAESACRDIEKLIEESAQKFELLGARHAALGVLHRDLWTVSRGIQNVREAADHTDETRMPHIVANWIRDTPAALGRLDERLSQLALTLESDFAQMTVRKNGDHTLKPPTTTP